MVLITWYNEIIDFHTFKNSKIKLEYDMYIGKFTIRLEHEMNVGNHITSFILHRDKDEKEVNKVFDDLMTAFDENKATFNFRKYREDKSF